jgi:hypothetical protein
MPTAAGRVELLGLARQSLAAARAAKRPTLEAQSLWMLGLLETGPEARVHLERWLAVAEIPSDRSYCQAALARRLVDSDPAAAEEAIHQALALAHESQASQSLTYAWHERMRVSWVLRPPSAALEDSRAALAALQAAQRDRMEDGAPAEAWAGVVVLGDGDQVPLPGGRRRRWPLLLLALAVLVLVVVWTARRRRLLP